MKYQTILFLFVLKHQDLCFAQSARQRYTRAKPTVNLAGQRMDVSSSLPDMAEEKEWIGGWQASPFPDCPLGKICVI
jgi:hypothetical protein